MIGKYNLMYELIGNSKPNGVYNFQDEVNEYVFRKYDLDTIKVGTLDTFLSFLEDGILTESPEQSIKIIYEYSWKEKEDRDMLIGEILYSTFTEEWTYTTYYRQQRHYISFKTLGATLAFIRKRGDDHRLNSF